MTMGKANKRPKAQEKVKLVQTTFAKKNSKLFSCPLCGFKIIDSRKELEKIHETYHDDFLNGFKIVSKATERLILDGKNVVEVITKEGENGKQKISVVVIACEDKKVTKLVSQILTVMNTSWLNSDECSDNWKTRPLDSKVVLLVEQKMEAKRGDGYARIIGVTTTDPPPKNATFLKGYLMQVEKSTILENKPLKLRLGISRIFMCPPYRRQGWASTMLECILKHAVYGAQLTPWQIGFSQPSGAGLLLLKKWYRGSNCIPVYHENMPEGKR